MSWCVETGRALAKAAKVAVKRSSQRILNYCRFFFPGVIVVCRWQ